MKRRSRAFEGAMFAVCAMGCCNLFAAAVQDYTVRINAAVSTNPPSITLSWPASSGTTGYVVYRKDPDALSWGSGINLASNAVSYVDSNVVLGGTYEYRITRTSTSVTGNGYNYAGVAAPLTEDRGKLVLLVDNTHSQALGPELNRLRMDLVGDGWQVVRFDVARTASAQQIKAIVTNAFLADPQNVEALFLFGHVPVPYSGRLNPDGHTDHSGAWPADVYYGDMDGTWTDSSITATNASRAENRNVPGDGKFDQTTLPSNVELQVGRVDLSNLAAFNPMSETELLRRYLNKNHEFRHKRRPATSRALIDDNFGEFSGEAFAASGHRNFAPLVGSGNIFTRDYFSTLSSESYLWAYGCGGGSYTSASGVGSTTDFANRDTRVIFTMLFGSYHGDWDSANNFMRAQLANAAGGLTCAWAGRPHWYFHHMGLGEPIGFSTRASQNNQSTYLHSTYHSYGRYVHIALMGDPTLRMHPVAPPSALAVVPGQAGGFDLRWNPSPEPVLGYHVYRASTTTDKFVRLNPEPIPGTTFEDPAATSTDVFMVRAVKLEATPSGSFYNASQGIFQDGSGTFLPALLLTGPTSNSLYSAPANLALAAATVDFANSIERVRYLLGNITLGESTNAPYTLDWTNVPPGEYRLEAQAIVNGGAVTSSPPVWVRVDELLVPAQSGWKYLDDGSNQGTAWRASGFDDEAWASGAAELGYSNAPVTVVSFGNDPTNKHLTTYFRKRFQVEDPSAFAELVLELKRDDGAVVYLNGAEVWRSNLPASGTINHLTRASSAVGGSNESAFFSTNIAAARLVPGINVVAVEVHQSAPDSSDLSFDLRLSGVARSDQPRLLVTSDKHSLTLAWPGAAWRYRLQTSSTLRALDWRDLADPTMFLNGRNVIFTGMELTNGFFRLVRE